MLRFLLGLVFLAILLPARPAFAGHHPREQPLSEYPLVEKVLGQSDAPVTMIEYSSLTCPHCMAFHRDTLPKIKEAYIDTGKVKLIFRDFPLGSLALAAAMLARCAPPERYFGMIEALFRSQEIWSSMNNPLKYLERIARLGGMSKNDVEACLKNEALMKAIQAKAAAGEKEHGIRATPTFVIEGEKVSGNLPFEDFRVILDKAVAKKQ